MSEQISTAQMRDEALWASSGTLANIIRSAADQLDAQSAQLKALRDASGPLLKRYLANSGNDDMEFVCCVTDDNPGKKMLKLWRALRQALAQDEKGGV